MHNRHSTSNADWDGPIWGTAPLRRECRSWDSPLPSGILFAAIQFSSALASLSMISRAVVCSLSRGNPRKPKLSQQPLCRKCKAVHHSRTDPPPYLADSACASCCLDL